MQKQQLFNSSSIQMLPLFSYQLQVDVVTESSFNDS